MRSLFLGLRQRACAVRHAALGLFLLGILTACGGGSGGSSSPGDGSSTGGSTPTLSLSASPATVTSGGSSILSWSSSSASSCSASGAWSGGKATSGSQTVNGITTTGTYTLTCSGSGGSVTRSVDITIGAATGPTLSLAANPSSVANNGSTQLTWSSTNTNSCTATGAWTGIKSTSGAETINGLTVSSTYVLTCGGSAGNVTRSVTVIVGAPPVGSTVTTIQAQDLSGVASGNVPVTFGHVFASGHIPSGATLVARTAGTSPVTVPLQVNAKATHADGSLRHAVLTARVPSIPANGTQAIELVSSSATPAGGQVLLNDLLATSFDAVVSLNVGGTVYQASARQMLQTGPVKTWLSGSMVSEWHVSGPASTTGGTAHPRLNVRFNIRAYAGLDSVRVDAIVENAWARETGPRNETYNATVTVDGKGTVFSQNNVTHYRQARWRRVFWWGSEPKVHIAHDRAYLQATATVPTYDPAVTVASSTLTDLLNQFNGNSALMGRGLIEPYMPSTGGRPDIAPLPSWTAHYIITQDRRPKAAMLGTSEQAGSFGIHYRDKTTDLPISLDTYPNLTILGDPQFFPACGGDCSTPYTPDDSHQPSLAYVPYLVTGDHYHLEELQFWANWNLFYQGDHGGSQGILTGRWVQIRATAWSLRTLGHAAFITPDSDPLKPYFLAKLNNNINYFTNWASNTPTPLGYYPNPLGGGLDNSFATWMDDFLTWSVGHLVNLGFSNARTFFDYKARFPVGRMTDSNYCWIMASTYWTPSRDGAGNLYQTWSAYKQAVIQSPGDSFRGANQNLTSAQMQTLIGASCNSSTMTSILGVQTGEMIGYVWSYDGYPANLQPALAIADELGATGADVAWQVFDNRALKPSGSYSYNIQPQWAVVPRY